MRTYPHVLPEHSVKEHLVAVAADPQLVAVVEIAAGVGSLRMHVGALLYPLLGENTPSCKYAVLQHHLSELRPGLRGHIKTPAALGNTLGRALPEVIFDAEGSKEPLLEEVGHRPAGYLFNDLCEYVGIHTVVVEFRAGSILQRRREEYLGPVGFRHRAELVKGHSRGHSQKMVHGDKREFLVLIGHIGEYVHQALLHIEQTVVHQHSHRHTRDGLGHRVREMPGVDAVAVAGALAYNLALREDHQAVYVCSLLTLQVAEHII